MSSEETTTSQRVLTWMRATRERYPDGITSVMLADQLDLEPNSAAAVLSKLFDSRCVTREKTNGARGGRLLYRYRYVTDVPMAKPVETRQKPPIGRVAVGDMLILIPIGKEAVQITVEDARGLYRHLSMLFGRSK
ncbi:hypothetical protein DPV79_15960 [Burkholderia reimsis]|uniref:Uncharacterized protein n=1 Tax=Burkholderia reimsis TaxID=2234132 RepID=A0A365QUR5_9BURK|nr:hypothetical protein [Burkholderia reimsis]RBB38874.1 hypothetical protein DPV79_15960 [Burkholderia reimsis]